MGTVPLAIAILAAIALIGLIIHYGWWGLLTLVFSTVAAWCMATAEWANLMHHANQERLRLYREHRRNAFLETGAKW